MKKIFYTFIIATLFACGGGDDGNDVTGGGANSGDTTYQLEVTSLVELRPEGEKKEVSITANCSWTISKSEGAGWLGVSPSTGHGTMRIGLEASRNTTGVKRNAVLTVTGGGLSRTVSVSQNPDPKAGIPQPGDNLPVED